MNKKIYIFNAKNKYNSVHLSKKMNNIQRRSWHCVTEQKSSQVAVSESWQFKIIHRCPRNTFPTWQFLSRYSNDD